MSPQPARAAALVVALLTLLPGALAGHDPNQPLEVHKPDLFPGSLRWSGTDERQPTTACMEVYNLAPPQQGIAGFFDVMLRVDRVLNGTPVLYREEYRRTQEPLMGGETMSLCWSFPLEAGIYRGAVTVDPANEVDEEVETNNQHGRGFGTQVQPSPRPNLAIPRTGLTVSPQDARDNFPQFFRVRVVNFGEEPSVATSIVLRDETGVLATLPLRALNRGESAEVVHQTDPSLRAPGSYRVTVVVDPDDLVEESDELDNTATRTYTIPLHPLPDLVVRELSLNGTLLERRALRLEANVSNAGNRTAGTTTFRFEIDGIAVANQTLDRIVMGANHTLVFPFYLTAGNHSLRVVADPGNLVPELDEANNDLGTFARVEALPEALRRPNLVIDRLSALPEDPGPGEVVTINTYVRNVGEIASEPATLALVLDGVRIGEVRIPPIQPDRYHSALYEWTNASIGPHTLRASVDAAGEVNEIHEDDNDDTLFFTIQAPRVQPPPPVNRTEPQAPPTQTVPTPPTPNATRNNTAQTPAPARESRGVEITQLSITTRPVPGGLKGRITVGLRNPSLEPIGRLTMAFRVDGQPLKEVLIEGIPGAGVTGESSGEVDLPPGEHRVDVEVRPVGSGGTPATASETYSAEAGEKEVPGPQAALVLLAVLALALRRRKPQR